MTYLTNKYLSPESKKIVKELEQNEIKLIVVGDEIRFQSEMDLENYIEKHFYDIFPELILLKRQHSINMQRCDLLCCDQATKQAVIIELKNEEDRYIVPQLVRYRDAIFKEKQFSEAIDYSLPVKLIAIAPIFHEHNYIDKEASKFEDDLHFFQFNIENNNGVIKFKLRDNFYDISYPILGLNETDSNSILTSRVVTGLARNFYYKLPEESRLDFQKLRSLFLAQPKIKEMISPTYKKILYATGDGKTSKKLAEIFNTKTGLYLFLWLPSTAKTNIKIPIARFGLICHKNQSPLSEDSTLEWLVCTNSNIDLQEYHKNQNELCLSFTRSGMSKWCKPRVYLSQVSAGNGVSSNTFWLLLKLLRNITPPIDNETSEWWDSIESNTPDNLGWYVDLAIKTWNHRIK